MAYLQHGTCYADLNAAKADFISRIGDIHQREAVTNLLQTVNYPEAQRLFPDCVPPAQIFNLVLEATMGIVGLLLAIRIVRKVLDL